MMLKSQFQWRNLLLAAVVVFSHSLALSDEVIVAEGSSEGTIDIAQKRKRSSAKRSNQNKRSSPTKKSTFKANPRVTPHQPESRKETTRPLADPTPRNEERRASRTSPTSKLTEVRRLYKRKQYRDAANMAHRLLHASKDNDDQNRYLIIKGLSLYHLGLKATALESFLTAARNRPTIKDLRSITVNAVAAARGVRAEEDLIPVFSRNDPGVLAPNVRSSLYYRLGKAFLRQKNPQKAVEFLGHVPRQSPNYLDALLLQGIAWNQLGDRGRSFRYFKQVLDSGIRTQEDQVVWELANLNAARVAFAQKDYIRSVEFYQRVPRSSSFWLDALFEMSWPLFHQDDTNMALGYLKTLHSPYFIVKFFPESLILRAIILFRLCKYGDMKKAVKFYRREYSPYVGMITSYLREKKNSPNAYRNDVMAYMSTVSADSGEVPGRVWDWIISDVYFDELVRRMKILEAEKDVHSRIAFGAPGLEQEGNRIIARHLDRVHGEMNQFIRIKLERALGYMRSLEDQINILELEQTLGEKQAVERLKEPHRETDVQVSVSIEEGYEFWPFTGEYWKDELGFYAYSTGDSCGGP